MRSLIAGWDHSWTVAGASTVAGEEAVVTGAETLFAGLCCATTADVTGAVAGICSSSRGSGARVSDGKAFDTTGVSTFGEEAGSATAFSFLAFAVVASVPVTAVGGFCVTISFGCLADLLDATTAAIGLGSTDGGASTFATSVEAEAGAVD
jgi:hypothetical protein